MNIHFIKMHGLGNDYVFVDTFQQTVPESDRQLQALSRAISDRHRGVGSDGLILIGPGDGERADFDMRIFNQDGSEGEMCGNGIRCFAKYVYETGYTDRTTMRVSTKAGIIRPMVMLDEDELVQAVRVDMGRPRFEARSVPISGYGSGAVIGETIEAAGRQFTFTAVSMGNPHCVIFLDDLAGVNTLDELVLEPWGEALERHEAFPERTNVEFVAVKDRRHLTVRVWERGSGATLACGTGACAVLAAAVKTGRSDRLAEIELPGGMLGIEWPEDGESIVMEGPAVTAFSGEYDWQDGRQALEEAIS